MFERGRKRQKEYYDIEKARAELKPHKIFKPAKEFRPKLKKDSSLKITLHSALNHSRSPSPSTIRKSFTPKAIKLLKEIDTPPPDIATNVKSKELLQEYQEQLPKMGTVLQTFLIDEGVGVSLVKQIKATKKFMFSAKWKPTKTPSTAYEPSELDVVIQNLRYSVKPELEKLQDKYYKKKLNEYKTARRKLF